MMIAQKVTRENLAEAIAVQEELFPGESGRLNFEESAEGITDFEYYLIYEEGRCAGITGLYHYPIDPKSAWLGWFGILKPFRRKHLGSLAMRFFEELARSKGYSYARLYTDQYDNEEAIAFYKANGYQSEPYENPDDPICFEYRVLIFSRSLGAKPLIPWNNRNIGLTAQIEKQARGNAVSKALHSDGNTETQEDV